MSGAIVVGAGAAVAALGLSIKAAGDLEQSVANISTIKPEIDTSAVFDSLNEMQTRVPQSADQLGAALYNVFSSVNVTQEEGLRLTELFAKGAVGAATDAETFGTAALGVMNAYGLSVDDAAHISDVFFNTVNAGVVTGKELAASLGPVTQSAKAAGVDLDTLGGMIAGVTKEGGPAAQNINNLNNLLQKFTTKEAQKAMNSLGVETLTATGAFRPAMEVLGDLKDRLGDMTEAQRANALQDIFPDAQARLGAQTIISQLDFVNAAILTNQETVGASDEAYGKMSATFDSQSKLMVGALMSVAVSIGGELLPIVTPLVTAFAQEFPGAFRIFRAALNEGVAAWGGMFSNLGSSLATTGETIGSRFNALGTFIATTGETIGGGFSAVGATVATTGEAIGGVFSGLGTAITETKDAAASAALSLGKAILDGIMAGIAGAKDAVGNALSAAMTGALDAARNAIGAHSPSELFAKEVGEPIIDGIVLGMQRTSSDIGDEVVAQAQGAIDMANAMFSQAAMHPSGSGVAVGSPPPAGTPPVSGGVQVQNPGNSGGGDGYRTPEGSGVPMYPTPPGFHWTKFGLAPNATTPGFAGGVSNFGGGMAWVGEQGPELLTLPGGSSVTPMGGGSGGRMLSDADIAALARAMSGQQIILQVGEQQLGHATRTAERRYEQANVSRGVGGL